MSYITYNTFGSHYADEDACEEAILRAFDALDRRFQAGKIDQSEYDRRGSLLDVWAGTLMAGD